MKKNYFFGKVVAGMAILFGVLIGFVSCGQVDNPLEEIINTETPITFTITKTSDTSAKTVILTPSNISDALKDVLGDIMDAAEAGETYTLTIDASHLTINDSKISIPKIDGADIVLEFENLGSSDKPLQFKASSTSDPNGEPSATALNSLTIIMPSSSTQDLDINLPDTHVELEGGYGTVTAITSLSTMVVKNGAVIDFLRYIDGSVIVEEGGKINGYIISTDEIEGFHLSYFVDDEHVLKGYGFMPRWVPDNGDPYTAEHWYAAIRNAEDNFPYSIKRYKIIKGEFTDVAVVDDRFAMFFDPDDIEGQNGPEEGKWYSVEELVIGDGVKTIMAGTPRIDKLSFEDGNSNHEILYGGASYVITRDDDNNITNIEIDYVNHPYLNLSWVKGVKNMTFKPAYTSACMSGYWDPNRGDWGEWVNERTEEQTVKPQISGIPTDIEDCKFIANIITWEDNYDFRNGVNVKNCTFELSNVYEPADEGDATNAIFVHCPEYNNEINSLVIKFEGCKLSNELKFLFNRYQGGEGYPEGSTINYIFKDCTHGNDAFNTTNFFEELNGLPNNIRVNVKIGTNDYYFGFENTQDQVMKLLPAND